MTTDLGAASAAADAAYVHEAEARWVTDGGTLVVGERAPAPSTGGAT